MPTYWRLDLTMNPSSGPGRNGRFEPNPALDTAPTFQGPWTPAPPPNTPGHFTVRPGDFVRIAIFDQSNSLANMQSGAAFGRDNAARAAGPTSSPFVSATGRVNCVLPAVKADNLNGLNGWTTADWKVQQAAGTYRFVVYAIMNDPDGNQYEFGHDPEMDVAGEIPTP